MSKVKCAAGNQILVIDKGEAGWGGEFPFFGLGVKSLQGLKRS